MEHNFWVKMWEDSDIPFHRQEVNQFLIEHINKLDLKSGDCILVPLCGKSIDMLWLAKQGYKMIGVELSSIAARAFFNENNLAVKISEQKNFQHFQCQNIEIFCGDFFKLATENLPPVKAIYDRGALIALPPDMRKKYVNHLINLTTAETKILLEVVESPCQVQGPPFPVDSNEIKMLYGKNFTIQKFEGELRKSISPHLMEKGYTEVTDMVYCMTKN